MMNEKKVLLFRPCQLEAGQRIHIEDGPRRGDWLVLSVSERKMKLRCPISGREFEWDRFCYLVEERSNADWPQEE